MFNGRCILTPYIPPKAHMDAVHVNTTTHMTVAVPNLTIQRRNMEKMMAQW